MCFFVRGDSIVEKEFVFCYCLFAVSIFGDSTAFGHHISLNSGSVYPPAVYCQEHERDGCVIEHKRSRCQQPLDLGNGIKVAAFDFPFRSISASETIKIDGMKDQLYFRLVEQS